jgi:hypothetical protein
MDRSLTCRRNYTSHSLDLFRVVFTRKNKRTLRARRTHCQAFKNANQSRYEINTRGNQARHDDGMRTRDERHTAPLGFSDLQSVAQHNSVVRDTNETKVSIVFE